MQRRSLQAVAGVVLAVSLAACGGPSTDAAGRPDPTPTSRAITPGPGCKLPRKLPEPRWLPRDLPLPRGTYLYDELRPKAGLHRGKFAVRSQVTQVAAFIRKRWPAAGYALARPDSEPGEAEALFTGPRGSGLFKANDVLCDPPYVTILLIYG